MSNKPTPRPRTIRCAIYTRKSTEEGLDQQYNSLDSQRDAGEAYIRSQANEGWELVPDRYDDGGFSGGNIERPALKRMMEDIQAGKIDCVVVYKVDRLSRSLLDFARVMETFDKFSVSFVSVTQHFNTTHSMGRLTLNILLSFAQFEREIIGERIRDKLAAQCRRGQWTGGYPVLGYDVDQSERTPKLVINPEEATKVRRIFSLYLEMKNLLPVVNELDERGWTNKLWHSKKGLPKGGRAFDKGSLHALLTNPIYCGKIKHKTDLYQGQHQAIVDQEIFDRVQAQLRENGFNRGNRLPSKHGGLLKGLIRCPNCNVAMVHNMTKRNSIVYRYYTCVRAIKRGRQACQHPSLPAGEIEAAVVDQVRDISRDAGLRDEIIRQAMVATQQGRKEIEAHQIQLGRQLARDHGEIRQLALDERPGGQVSHRIADIQERIEKAELELAKVHRQLVDLEKHEMSTQEIEDALSRFLESTNIVATRLPGRTPWSSLKVVENGDGFMAFCESTGESNEVLRADVICHQLNSRQLAAELNAALSLGRKPEWLDNNRRVWFLGNLSLELQARPVYMSLHIASDLITDALHATAAHARSTFLFLDLNSKRRDQKFDTSAKIVDCKPVELEQLFNVTSDGCLLAKSKSRELNVIARGPATVP